MAVKLKWVAPFSKKWFGKSQKKPEHMMKVTVNTECTACGKKNGKKSIVVAKQNKGKFLDSYAAAGAVLSNKCRYCNGSLKMI